MPCRPPEGSRAALTYGPSWQPSGLASVHLRAGTPWRYDLDRCGHRRDPHRQRRTPIARRILDDARFDHDCEGGPVARPTLVRSAPIMVGGPSVGRVEVTASLRPLLAEVGLDAPSSPLRSVAMPIWCSPSSCRSVCSTASLGELNATGEAAKTQNLLLDTALGEHGAGTGHVRCDERIVIANHQYAEIYGLAAEPGAAGHDFARDRGPARRARAFPRHERRRGLPVAALCARECTEPTHVLYKLANGRVVAAFVQPRATAAGW